MERKMTPNWWVLVKETEETVAICVNEACANWIAENFPLECVVRVEFH